MSIYPKVIDKSDIKPVTLHLRVENNNKNSISGRIVFVITDPKNVKKKIEEEVTIRGFDKIDKYYNYSLKKKALLGRYFVEGRFYFGKESILSENHETDFFDVQGTKIL
jgi:hypothetical protein